VTRTKPATEVRMHSLVQRPCEVVCRRRAALALAAVLALSGVGVPAQGAAIPGAETSAPEPATALQGAQLVAALRRGGYVVYFRHTATDFSRNDAAMTSYDDCRNQRLLSLQGQRDAAAIGERIRVLGLAGGEVLASPMCRTMDHARLMFRSATPRPDIRETEGGDYAGLKRLLAAPVPPGSNRWVVGHGNPFRAVAGPPHLAEGEAAVIEPGMTRWAVVARITVADWQALAPAP
jgi:hypothetical protein